MWDHQPIAQWCLSFVTDGINNFLNTVMGIDNQDILLKMEEYAIQGIKGEISPFKFSIMT